MNYDDRYDRSGRRRGRDDGYRYDPYYDRSGGSQRRDAWEADEDLPWFRDRDDRRSEQPEYRASGSRRRDPYRDEPAGRSRSSYWEEPPARRHDGPGGSYREEGSYRGDSHRRDDPYRGASSREDPYREDGYARGRSRSPERGRGGEEAEYRRPARKKQPARQGAQPVRSGGGGGGGKPPYRRKRRSPFRTALTLVLLVVLGALIGLGVYIHNLTGSIHFIDDQGAEQEANIKKVDSLTNILLVGEDARGDQEGGGQRTDSIILCTINPDTREVILTSFMRDMYVDIPGHKQNRINTAFSQGGIDLLEETIEKNFDVRIDGYIGIDFAGFLKVVAMMDKVQIELTEEEAAYMNEHPEYGSEIDWTTDVWDLKPGLNTLTPEQLLAYSRMRHVGNSDWERTERQRKVLSIIYDQFKSASVPKLLTMLRNVAPCITTDIQLADLLSYAYLAAGDGIQTVESNRIPADGTFTIKKMNNMDVLVPDVEANKQILQEFIRNERSNADAEAMPGEEAADHMGVMETEE